MGIRKILAAAVTAGMLLSFTPTVSMADSTGWIKDGDYWRYYTYEDGYVTNDWKQIGGKWYYFGRQSVMVSGVENYRIDDKFYDFASGGECLNPEGKTSLKQGWNKVCYLGYGNEENEWAPTYYYSWLYFGTDGKYYKGWHKIGGSWYYFYEGNGTMMTCKKGEAPITVDKNKYWLKESGEMVTGWYYDGQYWFYARSNGALYVSEWYTGGGKTYYFDYYGRMVCNAVNYKIGKKYYSFDPSGACIDPEGSSEIIVPGWFKETFSSKSYVWYYCGEDGKLYTGWHKIGGKWYHFGDNGRMDVGLTNIDGDLYCFKNSGEMVTGWYCFQYGGPEDWIWIYAGSNGKVYTDRWLNSNGKWYYFDNYGKMMKNIENVTIGGIDYSFDSNGVCKNPDAKAGKITGWHKRADDYAVRSDGTLLWYYHWYYYDKNGTMYADKWLSSGGKWYYFDNDGHMVDYTDYYVESEGKVYDFDSDGVCRNPYNGRKQN
ncbi:hypothetical protein [Butyrivibrio sp. AE2032]|uniref:hypothetical protein n=1 Tax=Butyrivibrio sp. AE2032 TaxID=1458463 RepID=UPI0005563882|nr:hypothetical protein [Butyrivibrio sp. AE2032]